MQQRVVLRHLSGSKVGQVDEFPVAEIRDLMIGSDAAAAVPYDPAREELVARRHARLLVDSVEPPSCSVMDLNSRNGTFVNRQRIFTAVKLVPGDLVQLGAGGPEFQFDIEPRPPGARPARVPATAAAAIPPLAAGAGGEEREPAPGFGQSKKLLWIALVVFLALLVAALAVWNARRTRRGQAAPGGIPNRAAIVGASAGSVVFFEAGWRLLEPGSGRQFYQVYQTNTMKDGKGRIVPVLPGAGGYLPVFVILAGETEPEPLLTTDPGDGKYKAIGGAHTGTGFLVGTDGLILTSRRVASAWEARYVWPREDKAGVVYILGSEFEVKGRRIINASQFPAWVPTAGRFVLKGTFGQRADHILNSAVKGRLAEGRNDYLDVTFAGSRVRIPARLGRISPRSGLATVKIEAQRRLPKLELAEDSDIPKPGDPVLVLGYAGVSLDTPGVARPKDAFNPDMAARLIPDPAVSEGSVGRIAREPEGAGGSAGEVYELKISPAGSATSGGPVLNAQGRVVAVYIGGLSSAGETAAAPIRYGRDLMGSAKAGGQPPGNGREAR